MTDSKIKYDLIMEIISGKLSLAEVQKRIKEYEAEYGEDFFDDYDVEKKDKPWDKGYLEKLKDKALAGLRSKQFILHVAEVSEYVHKTERKKANRKMAIIASAIVGVAAVILLIKLIAF